MFELEEIKNCMNEWYLFCAMLLQNDESSLKQILAYKEAVYKDLKLKLDNKNMDGASHE